MKSLLSCCCLLLLLSGRAVAFSGTVEDRDWIMLSGGISGLFDAERNPTFTFEYRFAKQWRGVRPWLGAGWATDGAVFVGGGLTYSLATSDQNWIFSVGAGPGYYERHQGADLGSHLEFYSFAEVARSLPWHHRVLVRLAHVSNGGITEPNPGAELLMLGYAMPLP